VHEGLDDAELILRSPREPELFGLLFERHAESMLGFFVRRTLDAESFASRSRFRDEGVDGVGWLYGIGKHLLSRYFRAGAVEARARRRLGMPERNVSDDDYDRIEELIDFERLGEALGEAMSTLPEEQREAVRLRAVDGRSYPEVAAELGCTESTARMRVSRGLRRIASVLETDPTDAPIELERRRWQRRSST
jgi:RNA polymerase sigma-70 factor (ECF subfamily)